MEKKVSRVILELNDGNGKKVIEDIKGRVLSCHWKMMKIEEIAQDY
jgi:hypothetical protein